MRCVIALTIMLLASVTPAMARNYVQATIPGDKNPSVPILDLGDPANPYRGQYNAVDEWAFRTYRYFINNDNHWTFAISLQSLNEDLAAHGMAGEFVTWRSYVERDAQTGQAYMIPIEVYNQRKAQTGNTTARTLQDMLSPTDFHAYDDTQLSFWSMGLIDQPAFDAFNASVLRRDAQHYPPIPEWMTRVAQWGDELYFLPDGGVVVNHKQVEDFHLRRATLRRYDPTGTLIKTLDVEDYTNWQRVMLTDPLADGGRKQYLRTKDTYEASGELSGRRSNVASTGRFTTFRDLDTNKLIAVVDYWQGKVLTDGNLEELPIDPYPYFNPLSYDYLAQLYNIQQELAPASHN